MPSHDDRLRTTLQTVQRRWDRLKLAAKRRLNLFEPVQIIGYRGRGTPDAFHVRGRVVEEKGVAGAEDGGLLRNAVDTVRRIESDEIPGARVAVRFGRVEVEDETDFEGFFAVTLEPEEPAEPGWHEVEVEVLESMAGGAGTRATVEIMVPPPDAEFAVVSDLDDTVIETHATDRLTEVRILFSNAPESRAPMPGAGPLWQALEKGPDGEGWNPFFYVSRSGWGLYDLFIHFLDANELPRGAMFLQDIAIIEAKSEKLGDEEPKRRTIRDLLEGYPDLPFVLVGDSGQEDPETYLELVREHSDRIRAVLIRDVTPPERDREVRRIVQEIVDLGVDAAAAESSVSLARAAADFDLIPDTAISDVRRAMVEGEARA